MHKPLYIFAALFVGLIVFLLGFPEVFEEPKAQSQPSPEKEVMVEKRAVSIEVINKVEKNNLVYENLKAESINVESISSELLKTLGQGPIQDFSYRFKNLKRLSNDLSKSELREIFKYLALNTTKEGDDRKEESIRNDLIEVLINQKSIPYELGIFMISNFNDDGSSFIWKDYIIQHIYPYISKVFVEKVKRQTVLNGWEKLSEEDELNQLISIYEKVAISYRSSYSGTALIGLERLYEEASLYDSSKLERMCEALIKEKASNQLSISSAIQILSNLNSEKGLVFAKKILNATGYLDDILISSCLNIYIQQQSDIDVNDQLLVRYSKSPLFSRIIKNNLASK